jgi:hypothetical protein
VASITNRHPHRAGRDVVAYTSRHLSGFFKNVNEAETRADHIDPALKMAGWGVVEGRRIRREYPYPITLGVLEGQGDARSR